MNEYKIVNVTDFLDVPEDRIDDCLTEFKPFLEYMRPMIALAKMGAESLGQDPEEALKVMAFTWIDDGKTDVTIRVQTEAS